MPQQLEFPSLAPPGYAELLNQLKAKVRSAQLRANLSVNRELIKLYWDFGESITKEQEENGWGSKTLEKLALDLQNEFPNVEGFSRTNLFRMRAFYLAYRKVPQAVGQLPFFNIPWGHNAILIEKLDAIDERLWYANMVLQQGWSRNDLIDAIEMESFQRQGKSITNFKELLPEPQSKLAQDILKDPYNFQFVKLAKDHEEKDLENGLIEQVQKFLMELGKGFAFVGRQYHLELEGDDYYLDILLYNLKLRCFFVIELKNSMFKPEHAGKMNFYLTLGDKQLKHETDHPSIGLILCKNKKKLTAEYALQDIRKPMEVAGYQISEALPTVEEIEEALTKRL